MPRQGAIVGWLLLLLGMYIGLGLPVGLLVGHPLLGLVCGAAIGLLATLPVLLVMGATAEDSAPHARGYG